ncbi:MAG: DNA integrity scanning protein DisA nucleotide-binding domain protein [Bacilli bacterium]|nr:DNA integrity scanning protein DisA nucleotide-binding domain protein [Bacilli bacterium]
MGSFLNSVVLATESAIKELNVWSITDIAICVSIIVLVSFFICFRLRRIWVVIGYVLLDALYVVSMFLTDMEYLPNLSLAMIAVLTVICLTINSGVLRKYLAKSLKTSAVLANAKSSYDKEKLIKDVVTAVNWLSENKVGALITFEKDTPMDDFMKSGTYINTPFTPEIVETIFYEGTRLHDGAIIIKGNTIIAAAVYYPPSTRAITGKFGARHRAALGISEVTDSITIVVSEETGRISIAHGGMLDNIKTAEFEKYFRNQIA